MVGIHDDPVQEKEKELCNVQGDRGIEIRHTQKI